MKKLSTNIFADYGLENADVLNAKTKATFFIRSRMMAEEMSAAELARASGISSEEISEILSLNLDRYSIESLNKVLAVFGKRVAVSYSLEDLPVEMRVTRLKDMSDGQIQEMIDAKIPEERRRYV
jgi:predicted XRE-type DNA-binding protein